MAEVTYINQYENKFWLLILIDNVKLMITALDSGAVEEVKQLQASKNQLTQLMTRANQSTTPDQLQQLNRDIFSAVQDNRRIFLRILAMQIKANLYILLKPSVINSMVDTQEEYLRILYAFINNRKPVFDPMTQENFWLPILIAQTRYISDNVGFYQPVLRQKADEFAVLFQNLLTFAIDLKGIYRTGLTSFPIEKEHHLELEKIMENFSEYVTQLMISVKQGRMPGSLSVDFLDRTVRIICYYTRQLAVLADISIPDCDPTAGAK